MLFEYEAQVDSVMLYGNEYTVDVTFEVDYDHDGIVEYKGATVTGVCDIDGISRDDIAGYMNNFEFIKVNMFVSIEDHAPSLEMMNEEVHEMWVTANDPNEQG